MDSFRLSEFCSLLENSLQGCFPETYWVKAEIASVSERGGHCYLDLVEKGEKGILSAKVRAVCWSNIYRILSAFFFDETEEKWQAGMQILVEVEVNFHAVYGLSLNVVNIDPSFTVGALMLQRQKTILRLQQEGVWDMQQQLPLPTVLRRIAIISSDSAAGYEDFVHQLSQSPYPISYCLFPATMQGDSAEKSILSALDSVYENIDEFDVLVIIRGGGASVDMSCFDSYSLCAHCAQFPLPILTGIGHTRDVSVLDMLVHSALKTPTAVAAFLVERMMRLHEQLINLQGRLAMTADRQILLRQHTIEMLEQRVAMCSPERIYRMGYTLTMVDGKPIKSVKNVPSGTKITTCLLDGQIISTVD